MPGEVDKSERAYLLTEGHFLGFGMGVLLARWWWAAVAWGAVLLTLWVWRLRATPSHLPCGEVEHG